MAVLQPSLVHWSVHTRAVGDAVLGAVAISVFVIVFEQRWERWAAVVLAFTGFASNSAYYFLPDRLQTIAIVLYHCSAVTFGVFNITTVAATSTAPYSRVTSSYT